MKTDKKIGFWGRLWCKRASWQASSRRFLRKRGEGAAAEVLERALHRDETG